MAIRKFVVGLVFVIFFSIGAGTVYAGWELVQTCTRADGVVFKIKKETQSPYDYRIRKCINGNCDWLGSYFSSRHDAIDYLLTEKDCA